MVLIGEDIGSCPCSEHYLPHLLQLQEYASSVVSLQDARMPLPYRLLVILATRLDSADELEGVSCAGSSAEGSVSGRAFPVGLGTNVFIGSVQ